MGGRKKFLDVMDVYYLNCGNDSWVYADVQTHQILYIKYVQFLYINYTSITLLNFRFKSRTAIDVLINV